MLCLGLFTGLDRPGPCPGHLPSQPYHPARRFPLRKCRQLSFGAGGKQVSEPRVMEPSGKTQGELSTPAPTQQHLALAFPAPLAGNVGKIPLLVTLVCPPPPHCLSHSPRNTAGGSWGGGSISALAALTAELGYSQHFYFKPRSVFEEASSVHR